MLVDESPENRVLPVLALVRENVSSSRRQGKAAVALEAIRARTLRGVAEI